MDVQIEARVYADPEVTRLVDEVQAEYVALYGGPDATPVEPEEFTPPHGLFLVGLLDAEPVVTGGWRRIDAQTAEIKRMYVVASARRLGLARRMLAELEITAADAGLIRLRLNSGHRQPAAIALYESAGYVPVPGFGPYLDTPGAVFMGKTLTAS